MAPWCASVSAARADDRVKGYSLRMRQRLGIARCLLADPELLILDEPMNGLDPAGILEMRGLIRDLVGEGRTVLLSSHLLDEVATRARGSQGFSAAALQSGEGVGRLRVPLSSTRWRARGKVTIYRAFVPAVLCRFCCKLAVPQPCREVGGELVGAATGAAGAECGLGWVC
jgi:ABC-type nitrate/sulfonate/bicarbonate transport system ATPase subunit